MKTKKIEYITISEIQDHLDEKHHVNYLYDYLKRDLHYYEWCEKKGYKVDPEGKYAGASQIWFKEYQQDPNGMALQPESLDFMKYCFDHYILDFNSHFFYFNDKYDTSHLPEWVGKIYLEICNDFKKLFKDGVVVALNE